jgi:hypothetical protein
VGYYDADVVEVFRDTLKRSRKGNLWKRHGGFTVCVFANRRGGWSWSIVSRASDIIYSDRRFESEDDAVAELKENLDYLMDK